jgi:hypothetical protein
VDENQDPATGSHEPIADSTEHPESIGGAEDAAGEATGDARAAGEKMIAQLQSMIDNVATQAAPVAREVGAKAAELAAAAADRAGPFAIRAADATADASEKLAVSARQWAAELRSKLVDSPNGAGGGSNEAESATGGSVAVADADEASAATNGGESIDQPGV